MTTLVGGSLTTRFCLGCGDITADARCRGCGQVLGGEPLALLAGLWRTAPPVPTTPVPPILRVASGLLAATGVLVAVASVSRLPAAFALVGHAFGVWRGLDALAAALLLAGLGGAGIGLAALVRRRDRAARLLAAILAGSMAFGLLLGDQHGAVWLVAVFGAAASAIILVLEPETRECFVGAGAPQAFQPSMVVVSRIVIAVVAVLSALVGVASVPLAGVNGKLGVVGTALCGVAGVLWFANQRIAADPQTRVTPSAALLGCAVLLRIAGGGEPATLVLLGLAGAAGGLLWLGPDAKAHFTPSHPVVAPPVSVPLAPRTLMANPDDDDQVSEFTVVRRSNRSLPMYDAAAVARLSDTVDEEPPAAEPAPIVEAPLPPLPPMPTMAPAVEPLPPAKPYAHLPPPPSPSAWSPAVGVQLRAPNRYGLVAGAVAGVVGIMALLPTFGRNLQLTPLWESGVVNGVYQYWKARSDYGSELSTALLLATAAVVVAVAALLVVLLGWGRQQAAILATILAVGGAALQAASVLFIVDWHLGEAARYVGPGAWGPLLVAGLAVVACITSGTGTER